MMSIQGFGKFVASVVIGGMVLAACDRGPDKVAQGPAPLPSVVVAPVTSKDVSASVVFIGQAQAFQRVEFRARVSGILEDRAFVEGATISADDLLFQIEQDNYLAAVKRADANLQSARATQLEAGSQLKRYQVLEERGTASEASLDEAKAAAARADASVSAAEAELAQANLDLTYTKITSPISGIIGQSTVDPGNLIGPDSGVLATVVDIDPVQVIFSVSERVFLEFRRERQQTGQNAAVVPKLKLADNQMYEFDGELNFVNNQVDRSTGTIQARVNFPNPDGLILPGQYVNVVLVAEEAEKQVVVPQSVVQANQAGPFVLVVDGENRVEIRAVVTGQLVGAEIVITEGLSDGETIIVEGIQKVRPGAKVTPVMQNTAK